MRFQIVHAIRITYNQRSFWKIFALIKIYNIKINVRKFFQEVLIFSIKYFSIFFKFLLIFFCDLDHMPWWGKQPIGAHQRLPEDPDFLTSKLQTVTPPPPQSLTRQWQSVWQTESFFFNQVFDPVYQWPYHGLIDRGFSFFFFFKDIFNPKHQWPYHGLTDCV